MLNAVKHLYGVVARHSTGATEMLHCAHHAYMMRAKRRPLPYRLGAALGLLLALASCSGLKYIPKGQKLYTGSKVTIEKQPNQKLRNEDALQTELESVVQPKPNSSILGLRPKLYFWHLGVGKSKGLGHWLANKFGEAPVLLSAAKPATTQKLLINRMQNRGYFHAGASSSLDTTANTGQVNYVARPGQQYTIKSIEFPQRDTLIDAAVRSTQANSLVKVGDPYDLDVLTNERVRIDAVLKNQGYYYFNPTYLLFQVDSTLNGQVAVHYRVKADAPRKATRPYWLKTVRLNTDYTLSDTTTARTPIRYNKYLYYPDESMFRAKALTRAVFLYPDSLYRQRRRDQTLSRLMSLGTFRFVEIKFEPSAAPDSAGRPYLDTDVLMTQLKKKSVRAELQLVSKSNGFTGPGLTLQYRNRSALRGAEQLIINGVASYEASTRGVPNTESRSSTGLLSTEFSLNAQLIVPRLIAPKLPFLNPRLVNSDYQPRTNFGLGVKYVNRTNYFSTTSYSANYGYSWKTKLTNEQEIKLIDVSYNAVSTDTAFDRVLLSRPFLRQAYTSQFILASSYRYTYNQQVLEQRRQQIFFQGQAELAGNFANLFASAAVGEKSATERYTIAGQPFAQYAKLDLELREYYRISPKATSGNRLVGRLQLGIGLPYGNSGGTSLPYVRQYGIGGPNSIRAFAPRQIGPGSYHPVASDFINNYYDQVGDLRLEGNLEYRQDLFPYVKGAAFVDAGNIWLVNEDPARPGGQFQANTFLKQLAVGAGLGIRIDVQFFVIRFDYAIPLRANYGVPDDKSGRLNIAIGYPF